MLIIPYQQLAAEVLDSMLQEFASRDGTDYGEVECSLAARVAQVKAMLQRGEIVICYDEASQSCDLLDVHEAKILQRNMSSES